MIPIDLKERENMILYFSLKNKHGYSLDNYDEVLEQLISDLKPKVQQYYAIIIPESSSPFLEDVVKRCGKPYIIVKKNNIQYFKDLAPTLGLQKAELKSHLSRMDDMGESFKINMLKATQRDKYIESLFCTTISPNNSIIIDDSNFSGSTKKALQFSTGCSEYLPIFTKG
ncbi:hypothetical protein pEaSNUABM50_00134 [Erwinia phage pEa_SNUABM_50]|uniref:Uncharacterized protein n=4 Tax=Eneladusvirus BF TaxID=2560751 RepID=A0A7L8ZNK5_9CAUD|nr:hypothetical protein FDH34_gp136 [Serratia phage BF]QOI71074.1 hypothetical protein pEaSNUABM12_00136 [Erwinia phage pEa_SNUABM_12]QOI71619.1 hypothetical protein pEaSNUABM47_00135 [Erwinia phage pEa_SNUABM_47]QOI72158.1 hypothetical protein pEaSNUABM50_00134 [Erwinia phage pEa_SNUABM_50]QXO11284.1 hypothetical protein pEaSNUABM19_00138 [Erwinia phage pEa_SNUABM_19]QXO11832.1 hypothetical protein pEaSNUABM44_00136 [Erwinia phage pEa_SNUABM_44]